MAFGLVAPFLSIFRYVVAAGRAHDEGCFAAVFLRPFSVSGMERSVVSCVKTMHIQAIQLKLEET